MLLQSFNETLMLQFSVHLWSFLLFWAIFGLFEAILSHKIGLNGRIRPLSSLRYQRRVHSKTLAKISVSTSRANQRCSSGWSRGSWARLKAATTLFVKNKPALTDALATTVWACVDASKRINSTGTREIRLASILVPAVLLNQTRLEIIPWIQ